MYSVHNTHEGTPYFTEPYVELMSKPQVSMSNAHDFLESFNHGYEEYLEDDTVSDGLQLSKFAGQLCYLSFSKNRTHNLNADVYFDNIKKQGHGSVLEHTNYSLLFYGISRACTHEIVRHRAGFAYSQVSQRYTNKATLRFVERPEYQDNKLLHFAFEKRIDSIAQEYADILTELRETITGRKEVNQVARSILNNEVEAPMIVTGNVRAWRHFIEMRATPYADTEIRRLAIEVYKELLATEPIFFNDYKLDNGCVTTQYPKV